MHAGALECGESNGGASNKPHSMVLANSHENTNDLMISSHLSAEIFRLPYKLYVAGVMVSIPTLGKYEAHFNRRFCCMNCWQTRRGLAFSETAESRDKPVTIIQSMHMLRHRLMYTFVFDPNPPFFTSSLGSKTKVYIRRRRSMLWMN